MADYDSDYIEKVAGYALMTITVVGVLGNVLTIVVFQRGKRCSNSWCAFYFKVLAVADIYALLSSALQLSLSSTRVVRWRYSSADCAYHLFNVLFCVEFSTWLTVLVTLDRAISCLFPIKGQSMATLKWMYTKTAIVCLFFIGINIASIITYSSFISGGICEFNPNDYDVLKYWRLYHALSASLLVCLLPAIINIACNIVIIRVLFVRASSATQFGLADRLVTSRRSDANAVMYRVIAIGVIHLLSTVPMMIHSTAMVFAYFEVIEGYHSIGWTVLADAAWTVVYLPCGLNFLVYGLVGGDFRKDLKDIVCVLPARWKRMRPSTRENGHTALADISTENSQHVAPAVSVISTE